MSDNTLFPLSGIELKAQGQARAANAQPEWFDEAYRAVVELARGGGQFTSEEVTERVGLPTGSVETNRNNAVGALFSAAARRGVIQRVGYRKAKRVDSHARVVAVWVGTTTYREDS